MTTAMDKWKSLLTDQGIPFSVEKLYSKDKNNEKAVVKSQAINVGVKKNYEDEWDTAEYRKFFGIDSSGEVALDIVFDLEGNFLRFEPFMAE